MFGAMAVSIGTLAGTGSTVSVPSFIAGLPSTRVISIHPVTGTGELVAGPEHVADVHADGALQFGLEGDVAAHGLPVAVEGDADELSVAVDLGSAAFAAVLFNTLESMSTPCSVKQNGAYRKPIMAP